MSTSTKSKRRASELRAAIYTRVSLDKSGRGRSPEEQEQEARDVCADEGWTVVAIVTDSVGASRRSKGTRHGWEAAKQLIERGEIDVLVTWEHSRAGRDLSKYVELRELCARTGVLWNYEGSTYDLNDGEDRFRTGQDALDAERESEKISKRVSRHTRAAARAGRPHGRRRFGYLRVYDESDGTLVGQVPHPDEAPLVRFVFAEYLKGAGLRLISHALAERGVRTSNGTPWGESRVREVLMSPSYAGRRVHQGQVVGEADWEPLVDPETFDRVQALLVERRTYDVRSVSTAHLLTGVLRCGRCSGKMRANRRPEGRLIYVCLTGCVSRDLTSVDLYVSSVLLERLRRPITELHDDVESERIEIARRCIDESRAQLAEAVALFGKRKLSATTLAAVEASVAAEIAEHEATIRTVAPTIDVDLPTSDHETWWAELTPAAQRIIVNALFASIVIGPVGRGWAKRDFDADSLRIEWRRW